MPVSAWDGKIYSHTWKQAGLGTEDVIEKATGAKVGTIGIASTSDVATAAEISHEAQKAWANVFGPKRGDVLREAARLVLLHAE